MRIPPFLMKYEMHLHYVHLPYEEKGDACNRGASHIRSPCPKISGPMLSLATLSNFLKPPCALTLLSTYTLMFRCCLPSSILALEHSATSSPTSKHAVISTPASECIATLSPTRSMPPSTSSMSPTILEPRARCHRSQARHRCP
jgi:hypothetical protein